MSESCRDEARAVNPWLILAVLSIGLFMILLDSTIVAIAIPHIMVTYRAVLSSAQWVMNAYDLTFAVTLVTLGRFGDLFGRRRLFLTGLVVFTASSLVLGLSPTIGVLIAASAAQGLGGAAMMPATLSIIAAVFPAGKRLAAMGVWGTISGVSMAIGPFLGGLLITAAGWRWIFLINVPIGLVGLLLAVWYVPESKNPTAVETLDLPGVGLISVGLFCLTFAIVEGQRLGWGSATISILFAVAVLGLIAFYFREQSIGQPLVDFRLFRHAGFFAGNVVGLLLSAAMMTFFFTIPIFLQTVLGYSALKAGLLLSPMSVAIVAAAPLSDRAAGRFGYRWVVAAGMLTLAVSIVWLAGLLPGQTRLDPSVSLTHFLGPLVLGGFGIAFSIAPVTAVVMSAVPRDQVGAASGVLSTARQMGTLMGIVVLGAALQSRLVANVSRGVEALQGLPAGFRRRVAAGIGDLEWLVAGLVPELREVVSRAYGLWFTDAVVFSLAFGVAMAVAGGLAALFLRCYDPKPHKATGAEPPLNTTAEVARSEVTHQLPQDVLPSAEPDCGLPSEADPSSPLSSQGSAGRECDL